MDKMRLKKFLSNVGFCSRRQAEEYIRNNKIFVNGKKAILSDKVSDKDDIVVDGQKIAVKESPKKKVIVFNKPTGVDCTLSSDPWGKTLLDFDFGPERVFPIGRLDKDSHGLLLLTNDGELGNRLASPSVEHEEEYLLIIKEILTSEVIVRLQQVVIGNNTILAPHLIENTKDNLLRVILHEGRSKYLRKMCDAGGLHVKDLQRIRVGTIELGELQPGKWKALSDAEFMVLKKGSGVPRVRRRIVVGHRK